MEKIKISDELRSVFEKLIPIYEKAVEEMPENRWWHYIWQYRLQQGICYASLNMLNCDIEEEMSTIGKKLNFGYAWFKLVFMAKNHTEAKELLQKRVDIMKELLKN